jgi:hypothetical protein
MLKLVPDSTEVLLSPLGIPQGGRVRAVSKKSSGKSLATGKSRRTCASTDGAAAKATRAISALDGAITRALFFYRLDSMILTEKSLASNETIQGMATFSGFQEEEKRDKRISQKVDQHGSARPERLVGLHPPLAGRNAIRAWLHGSTLSRHPSYKNILSILFKRIACGQCGRVRWYTYRTLTYIVLPLSLLTVATVDRARPRWSRRRCPYT